MASKQIGLISNHFEIYFVSIRVFSLILFFYPWGSLHPKRTLPRVKKKQATGGMGQSHNIITQSSIALKWSVVYKKKYNIVLRMPYCSTHTHTPYNVHTCRHAKAPLFMTDNRTRLSIEISDDKTSCFTIKKQKEYQKILIVVFLKRKTMKSLYCRKKTIFL